MSKLATAKTVAEVGQIVTSVFAAVFDRVKRITDMDSRIKKREDEVSVIKEKTPKEKT